MIKVLYVFFTGLLLSVFVGVGIAAFYPAPERPEYPVQLEVKDPTVAQETAQEQQLRLEYDQQTKQFEEDFGIYSRNVSLIALAASLVFMVAGLVLTESYRVIGDGFLLGGLFTLLYSVIMGFQTQDNRYQFILVSIGLIISLVLGYLKFVKVSKK